MEVWVVDETDDEQIELTAPNGVILFTVSKETAAMVGEMLINAADLEDYDDY